jgi:hypothetical protein
MAQETMKALLMIAMFGVLEAVLCYPRAVKAKRRTIALQTNRVDASYLDAKQNDRSQVPA